MEPPQLRPWEGPFADPTRRLPQAPEVAAQRRAAQQRWRERQRVRVAAERAAAVRDKGAQTPVGPLPAAARETAS